MEYETSSLTNKLACLPTALKLAFPSAIIILEGSPYCKSNLNYLGKPFTDKASLGIDP
jgi:hypothetical protein